MEALRPVKFPCSPSERGLGLQNYHPPARCPTQAMRSLARLWIAEIVWNKGARAVRWEMEALRPPRVCGRQTYGESAVAVLRVRPRLSPQLRCVAFEAVIVVASKYHRGDAGECG
jgi:hypothetical protein